MTLLHPNYLIWLWILVPTGLLLAWALRRRRRILKAFAHVDLFPVLLPGHAPARRRIKAVLLLAALALAIVALAGPQWGFRWEKVHQKGVDIMIALDCSQSMMASDIAPNRLERAKREIIDLLGRVTGDRVGLVAFSGQAILQCPLTLDKNAFQVFLRVLSPDYLPVGGTNVKAAIEAAAAGFEPDTETEKAIILITDGENTGADLTATLETMAKQGIRIFSMGVGDPAGAPIPDPEGGFKKDDAGNIVLSKVDMGALETMAERTGGLAVRSVAGDLDLEKIYIQRIKGTLEQRDWEQGKRKVLEQRFQWVLLPCVLLLFLELWLPVSRRMTGGAAAKGVWIAALLIPLYGLIQPTPALANKVKQGVEAFESGAFDQAKTRFIEAQLDDPEDPRLYYNIGTAAYKTGDLELAARQFKRAAQAEDAALRQNARYNLANTRYRQGDLENAIEEYEALLEEFPQDQQAKENLEFVRKKQEEQQQQQQNKDESKDSDKQDQNKKDQDKQDQNKSGQNQQDQGQQDKNNQNQDSGDQKNQDQSQPKDADQDQKDSQNDQTDGQNTPPSDPKDTEPKEPSETGDQSPGPPPPPKPDDASGEEGDSAQAGQAAPVSPGDQARDQKLNRLEDKPGMALMPVGQPGEIQKDW